MEIRLVAGAGFCFGVKRAVDTVYEQIQTGKTIYTYGSIVNNEVVVKELTEQGVHVIESRGPMACPGKCSSKWSGRLADH